MQTESTSEHLFRMKELIGFIADPNIRLAILFAAIEYGQERANAAIDSMGAQWQRSIDERFAAPAPALLEQSHD